MLDINVRMEFFSSQEIYYRVLHDVELGGVWRPNLPEVFLFSPEAATPMTEELQWLTYSLFRYGAPSLDEETAKRKWRSVYQHDRALANGTGFNDPNDPRADYINRKDLDKELPRLDKYRVCGGASLRGTINNNVLEVETLRSNSLPTIDELVTKPWLFFHATTSRGDGTIGRFPQGGGEPVLIPLVTKEQVSFSLDGLQKIEGIADPYKIYL